MTAYLDYFDFAFNDYFADPKGDFYVLLGAAGVSDEEALNRPGRLFGAFYLLP